VGLARVDLAHAWHLEFWELDAVERRVPRVAPDVVPVLRLHGVEHSQVWPRVIKRKRRPAFVGEGSRGRGARRARGRPATGARKADAAPLDDVGVDSDSSQDGGDARPPMGEELEGEVVADESGSEGVGSLAEELMEALLDDEDVVAEPSLWLGEEEAPTEAAVAPLGPRALEPPPSATLALPLVAAAHASSSPCAAAEGGGLPAGSSTDPPAAFVVAGGPRAEPATPRSVSDFGGRPRFAAELRVDVPGGVIRWYRTTNQFTATCNNPLHLPKCVLTRASSFKVDRRAGLKRFGRPMGLMAAFLHVGGDPAAASTADHFALAKAMTREERRLHRAQVATMAAALPLFARERSPNRGEECSEPEEV
jgi:hypothetical protein